MINWAFVYTHARSSLNEVKYFKASFKWLELMQRKTHTQFLCLLHFFSLQLKYLTQLKPIHALERRMKKRMEAEHLFPLGGIRITNDTKITFRAQQRDESDLNLSAARKPTLKQSSEWTNRWYLLILRLKVKKNTSWYIHWDTENKTKTKTKIRRRHTP